MGDSYGWSSLAGLSRYWWSTDVVDLALEVDLFGEDMLVQKASELLLLNQGIAEATPNRYIVAGQARRRQNPWQVFCVLEIVFTAIRKELKRTTRQSVTHTEILILLNATVVRPEYLSSK
jgi:hypothetical protein